MKNWKSLSTGRRFAATLAIGITALILAACGGGGGGSAPAAVPGSPVVVPVIATGSVTSVTACVIPNGAAACVPLVSWTTTNAATPTLKVGLTTVSTQAIGTNFAVPALGVGTYAIVLSNGATILDASKSVTVGCIDGSAIIGGVCTVQAVCVAPAMVNALNACVSPPAPAGYTWNAVLGGGVWEANEEIFSTDPVTGIKTLTSAGTLVTGANQMTNNCQNIGDTVWLNDSATGKIKYVRSGLIVNGRPISDAYVQTCSSLGVGQAGIYNLIPMYADALATSPSTSVVVWNGGSAAPILAVKGTDIGVKAESPASGGTGFFVQVFNMGAFVYNSIAGPL